VDDHPLAVLILSSRNRNLFGSVPYIDLPVYAVVGFLRILLAATALYFVGRWYGDRTVTWVENNVGEPPVIYKWMERAVDRAGWLAVYLMPGSNVVCLLVGHRKMSPRTFFACVIPGIITKLTILWIGGRIFEDQVRSFLNWIEDYQWWVVAGLFALSALQVRKRNPIPPETLETDVNIHDAGHPHTHD
jgi:membrane protein DedA with SNARE-associated domain